MEVLSARHDIIQQLQQTVIALQRNQKPSDIRASSIGLGVIEQAFAEQTFPLGVVHEFISPAAAHAAATNGFISGLLSSLMLRKGTCMWISNRRTLFPQALKVFGIAPERIVFVDLARQKDVLWAIEEALKCDSLSAVVGELKELSFTESRRLQLAVEQSRVTGFIHRYQPRTENVVACVSRWRISPLPSFLEDGMPGVGFPRWNVQLVKVRNGRPGTWQLEWSAGGFQHIKREIIIPGVQQRKTG